jgi:pyridoxal biosynthesis lyase PdxS
MDVVTPEQARLAEEAGACACAVMALDHSFDESQLCYIHR